MTSDDTLVLGSKVGSGNIGEAIYDRLAEDGWMVTGTDCRVGGEYKLDPSLDWSSYKNLVVTLGKEGITPFDTCSYQEVVDIVNGSLMLPLLAMHTWVQARQGLGGKCVVIGSYAYDHAPTACAPYCAAKAGLAQAIYELGWELTDRGYQFHIVHPYHVPSTPMGKRVVEAMVRERGFTEEEAKEYQKKDMKLDHHLTPEVIAEYVRWLVAAPEAEWLSGQGLHLYGGTR
jgi:NAD(P)-dependent dehydrogenase (short-subunit alcohol dehydrogenase family)